MTTKILVVESHHFVRQALRGWIEAKFPDCRVFEATTGEEAVELTQSQAPHAVVMDINLPGINGLQATAQIKAVAPTTKVIILTSYDGNQIYRTHAIANGASACLEKGMNLAEFETTLTDLLPPNGAPLHTPEPPLPS
jgi:DNA-binding NarL/FixJ family response regulator